MKYENPVSQFNIGDIVRIGRGRIEWEIAGKGATSGLSLLSPAGKVRHAQAFDVSLVRRAVR